MKKSDKHLLISGFLAAALSCCGCSHFGNGAEGVQNKSPESAENCQAVKDPMLYSGQSENYADGRNSVKAEIKKENNKTVQSDVQLSAADSKKEAIAGERSVKENKINVPAAESPSVKSAADNKKSVSSEFSYPIAKKIVIPEKQKRPESNLAEKIKSDVSLAVNKKDSVSKAPVPLKTVSKKTEISFKRPESKPDTVTVQEKSVDVSSVPVKVETAAVKNWNKDRDLTAQPGSDIFFKAVSLTEAGKVKEAAALYAEAAEKGLAEAQYEYSVCLFNGTGVEASPAESLRYLKMAAAQGYDKAQTNLGIYYRKGYGTSADDKEAAHWLKLAADQGDTKACMLLAGLYERGLGVKQDYAQALHYYLVCANQGSPGACNTVGAYYQRGMGTHPDSVKAAKFYKIAADAGEAGAQFNIGQCYYNGDGVEKSYENAFKYYAKAAEAGIRIAQYSLGNCYLRGIGTPADVNKGVYWLSKAAENGSETAAFSLAVMYRHGDGVKADAKEAVKWLECAAQFKYPPALYALGMCFRDGEGVTADRSRAKELFQEAALLGMPEAAQEIQAMNNH